MKDSIICEVFYELLHLDEVLMLTYALAGVYPLKCLCNALGLYSGLSFVESLLRLRWTFWNLFLAFLVTELNWWVGSSSRHKSTFLVFILVGDFSATKTFEFSYCPLFVYSHIISEDVLDFDVLNFIEGSGYIGCRFDGLVWSIV